MIKDYVMKRLEAGETVDEIGKMIAARFNEAIAEHEEHMKAQEKKARKNELIHSLLDILNEYSELEGLSAESLQLKETDVDEIVKTLDTYISLFKSSVFEAPLATKKIKSADDILGEFATLL